MLFDGKVALVTGGASGIGRAAALGFAREGARVVIADIADTAGEEVVAQIRASGGDARFIQTNMLDTADIQKMVAYAVSEFGRLDVALNNAGHRGGSTNLLDCTDQEWDHVMGLNLRSVWQCMKHEIPEMLKVGGGSIVNTSSGLGNFAGPNMASYTTSKHAVIGLTRSAAVDFGPKNIRVNALLPGATDTPMLAPATEGPHPRVEGIIRRTPLRRIGRAEEQAEAAIWLCSDRAGFVSGLSLICDGGVSIVR
jgi:NAD(P)-dependent dehydrogenase (short-subunit alcohol dehydrogenase family)